MVLRVSEDGFIVTLNCNRVTNIHALQSKGKITYSLIDMMMFAFQYNDRS